jgi:arabinose-5-phosphate isomerase
MPRHGPADKIAAMTFDPQQVLSRALQTFDIEAAAVQGLKARTGRLRARRCGACWPQGRVVVMGMGKSGHVGRKIAATLASTGTPALFVHPAEASHGDLGMITPADVVLAISNSGESASSTPSCRWSSAWARC